MRRTWICVQFSVVSVLNGILYYAPNFGNKSAFHSISITSFCKKRLNFTCVLFVRKSRAHANTVLYIRQFFCFVSQIELQVVRSCLYWVLCVSSVHDILRYIHCDVIFVMIVSCLFTKLICSFSCPLSCLSTSVVIMLSQVPPVCGYCH